MSKRSEPGSVRVEQNEQERLQQTSNVTPLYRVTQPCLGDNVTRVGVHLKTVQHDKHRPETPRGHLKKWLIPAHCLLWKLYIEIVKFRLIRMVVNWCFMDNLII